MAHLDTREWLLTNGVGGFASGTICDAHTRTYHGWLIAALAPPGQRRLLLARLDATLEVDGKGFDLGTNFWVSGAIAPHGYIFLHSFSLEPVPTWIWRSGDWQLSREILMPYGWRAANEADPREFCNRVLIRYRYQGPRSALLKLRLLIGDRDFHSQQHADSQLTFSQVVEAHRVLLQASRPQWRGTPWQLSWTEGHYESEGTWYWSYHYLEETQRGLGDQEDLYSPGYLTIPLATEAEVTLEARVNAPDQPPAAAQPTPSTFDQAVQAEIQRLDTYRTPLLQQATTAKQRVLLGQLLRAADQFVTYRASITGPTVIAGYHWFNDWGRDTLIALPGLALVPQNASLARGLLATFGKYCRDGLIPNTFPDGGSIPAYNSLDAVLWWIETLGLYVEATGDWAFLREQYTVVRRIHKSFMAGTIYQIRIDAVDGLLTWDAPNVALTWMDAVVQGRPITPRQGKPIEINALWYSALCWAKRWATCLEHETQDPEQAIAFGKQARLYGRQADQVKGALQSFWNGEQGYFYDRITPDDRPDPQIRPNAILALALSHCALPEVQARQSLQVARDLLLTPYGLRSLSPTDPQYVGRYPGDPIHRDRAYHQGTVWSWLIGPFIRAWQRFYPDEALPWDPTPLLEHVQHQACLGSISEIFDGDPPHLPHGAIAQAWSVAELLRHWQLLYPETEGTSTQPPD